jgi:predicted dehydrogenase
MYLAELEHFLNLIEGAGRAAILSDGEQGAAVLTVALAALQSAAEGRTIHLDESGEPAAAWLSRFDRP